MRATRSRAAHAGCTRVAAHATAATRGAEPCQPLPPLQRPTDLRCLSWQVSSVARSCLSRHVQALRQPTSGDIHRLMRALFCAESFWMLRALKRTRRSRAISFVCGQGRCFCALRWLSFASRASFGRCSAPCGPFRMGLGADELCSFSVSWIAREDRAWVRIVSTK